MPYGSKTPYKARTSKFSRSKTKKKTPTTKQLAKRVRKLEVAPEWKYFDKTEGGPAEYDSSPLYDLSEVAGGDDFFERVGNQITAKRVDLNIRAVIPAIFPSQVTWQMRVIMFWDLSTVGNAAGSYYSNTSTSPTSEALSNALIDDTAGQAIVNAPFNYRTRERFRILHDKIYNINPDYELNQKLVQINKSIPLHNAIIKYVDNVGDVNGQPERSLRMQCFTSGNGGLIINQFTRLWFTDV